MPNYAQDDKWKFDYEWNKMKERLESLEKRLYWLEDYRKKQEEKQVQGHYRNKH